MKVLPLIISILIFQSYLCGNLVNSENVLLPEHRLNGSFVDKLLGEKRIGF